MTNKENYPQIRKELYFSENMSDVLEELKRRQADRNLEQKLKEVWDSHQIPFADFLNNGPYAVLSRSVATPNLEQLHFLETAGHHGLKPVILEYDGKFVTKNLEKFCLCKMNFINNNQDLKSNKNITVTDINKYQGKHMGEIKTFSNQSLIDFHHNLFWRYANTKSCQLYNFTEWFNETRTMGPDYYFFFLLIFIKNAILFDNYVLSDKFENEFIEKKIIPSIKDIVQVLGIKPLIFPLVETEDEANIKWLSYNEDVEVIVENSFKKE